MGIDRERFTEEYRRSFARYGADNPNWKGGIATKGNCLDCGKKLKSYPAKYCLPCACKHHRRVNAKSGPNHYNWKGGKPKCIECGKEIDYGATRCNSCARTGEKNIAWNGGLSFHGYPIYFNGKLKKAIRRRDKSICFLCGRTEEETGKGR